LPGRTWRKGVVEPAAVPALIEFDSRDYEVVEKV
jgi:hypothetical protein